MAETNELAYRVPARISLGIVRRSEWVVFAFLIYAMGAVFFLPIAAENAHRLVPINLVLMVVYGILILWDTGAPHLALSVTRDWLPLAVTELAYQEMGWFTLSRPGNSLEKAWVIWDRGFLHGGAKTAIEIFGPVLPGMLELAYALTYTLAPFSVAVLYICRRRRSVDQFEFIFVLAVLLCYAQYPFWPTVPPRLLFFGADAPSYNTVFRQFNWWLLGNLAIHTSVFPSAHVAGAFSAAFAMRRVLPAPKWVSRFLFAMAGLIALATVYGRYHYAADALAGFAVALIALAIGIVTEHCSNGKKARLGAGRLL